MPSPKSSSALVRVALAVAASSVLLGACRGPAVADPDLGGPDAALPGEAQGAPEAGAGAPATVRATEVLRAWDETRSRAFAAGDVAGLRKLYVDGSAAGTSDAQLLRAYLRRGLRVEGMHMQLLAVHVLREERGLLRVRVTDRLNGAIAVRDGARTPLPQDRASTRLVELRRSREGHWRVATIRESARRPGVR